MIEVEVKIRIDSIPEIITSLENQGFVFVSKIKETDVYFNGVDRDLRVSDEALRIRKTDFISDNESSKYVLTYKGPKLDTISMSRKEIEVEVNDFYNTKAIIEALKYKAVLPVVKTRTLYKKSVITASIDEVVGLGNFLELEIIVADESLRENALNEISIVLNSLGYSINDVINISYLSMLEKGISYV